VPNDGAHTDIARRSGFLIHQIPFKTEMDSIFRQTRSKHCRLLEKQPFPTEPVRRLKSENIGNFNAVTTNVIEKVDTTRLAAMPEPQRATTKDRHTSLVPSFRVGLFGETFQCLKPF
jgi:hypothetical protein